MKQEEINKRFDEYFDDEYITRFQIKSFLHSEISLAVAEREKEIVEMINENKYLGNNPHYVVDVEDIIYLITKQK